MEGFKALGIEVETLFGKAKRLEQKARPQQPNALGCCGNAQLNIIVSS
jgi:hypothetical protein